METKRLEITVKEFLAFVQLPQDVRVIQEGNILYTGSITRIPSIILNEKIIHISIVYCTDLLRIEIE